MKKNKLTLYIIIALILGVAMGYVYNTKVINEVNAKISEADANTQTFNTWIAEGKDTTSSEYIRLKSGRKEQVALKQQAESVREDKLEGFSILSDIFLRLIKMIVAPLVFTTLVVGVAKVGDIKAVGRIGGKTLLWFITATFISLALGMILVNLFEPGSSIHLSLPEGSCCGRFQKIGDIL